MFLMLSSNPAMNPGLLKERSKFIRDRQTGRMDFVGANETTKPVIEADYARLITLLDLHLESGKEFLFGHRPSQADYGLFGQLSQLHRVENTSRELLESLSMRVTGWLSFMTDLSGRPVLDEHWDTELAPTTKALRKFIKINYTSNPRHEQLPEFSFLSSGLLVRCSPGARAPLRTVPRRECGVPRAWCVLNEWDRDVFSLRIGESENCTVVLDTHA